jgi:hypothetical protein
VWQYPIDLLLALTFCITGSHLSKSRGRILPWLYNTLQPLLSQRLRNPTSRRAHGVHLFGHLFTWMIDGTEQPVLIPSTPIFDTLFYSAKKNKHTVTALVIISFNFKFLFISSSFPGMHHDCKIAQETKDEWYPHLGDDEWGLADSGFNKLDEAAEFNEEDEPDKEDALDQEGWHVVTPPCLWDSTHKIAHYRIRVEQAIGELKNFRVP